MSNVKNMMCTTLTRSMPAIAFFELSNTFALVFIIYSVQDYADHFGGDGGPLEKMVGPLLATQILSTIVPFPTNLNDFTQNLTLIGVLLYYIGLMHDIDNLDEAYKSKEEKEKEDDKPSTSKAKAN
ncbi:hypothetical protein Bca52824_086727 [Brassica carinata]|uniref:Uncharacterized protein n=1 Tax=Brassica carinata TaxID=52824 RepID=A0A8X7P6V2_BRACI|nr:hypothetical protein Bca52824_086727 [Brassica carinata]